MKRKVIENYMLCDVVGEGSFGQVYKAVHGVTKEQFAVKVISLQKFRENPQLQRCAANQIRNLTRIEPSPHIVRFVEMLKTPNNCYFVYQFCNGNTLQAKLKQEGRLSETEAMRIFTQLLDAFKVLNKYSIMHRDLKPDNIFFHDGQLKLGDFGFCKSMPNQGDMTSTMLGSPIYMAPEVLRGEIYTSKADIWSLGVVLYEMIFGICPFESKSIAQLITALDSTPLHFPSKVAVTESTLYLLKRLLTKDQFKRIDWFELLTMDLGQSSNPNIVKSWESQTVSKLSLKFIPQMEIEAEKENSAMNFRRSSTDAGSSNLLEISKFAEENLKAVEVGFKKTLGKYNPESQNIISSQTPKHSLNKFNESPFLSHPVLHEPLTLIEPLQHINNNIESLVVPPMQRRHSLPLQNKNAEKRSQILQEHNNCLLAVKTAMSFAKYQDPDSVLFSYLIFKKVQRIMENMLRSISSLDIELADISSTVLEELSLISGQVNSLESLLLNNNTCSALPQSVLRTKFNEQSSNKCLWYEMISFLTDSKIDPKGTEIEWNNVIHTFIC